MSQGVMPLVGYNYASGNRKRMRDSVIYTAKLSVGFTTAAVILYIIFSKQIVSAFMQNPKVVEYGSAFLIGQTIATLFLNIDFLGVGVFQACGMGKLSLIFAILRKIVLEIPALFVLNKIWPMYGLAYAGVVSEVVLSTVAIIQLKKILNEK